MTETKNEVMRVVVNGRLVEMAPGATVGEVKNNLQLAADETLVEVSGASALAKLDTDPVQESRRYRSIPPASQG
jgi:sulfur carrier protein ThiS